jgi:hypothetical protein
MRELALTGLIAAAFGLGSYYATKQFGTFSTLNLVLGSLLLVAAFAVGARRLRFAGGPLSRRVIGRGLLLVVGALALGVGLERVAARSQVVFDWTFERRFELSPGTLAALDRLPEGVRTILYHDRYDPRTRRTRLLLETIAQAAGGKIEVDERILDESPGDTDRYEIGTSNSVVVVMGDRFETVERATEGALYEALQRLTSAEGGTLVLLRGEGQGDPEDASEIGYSGLASALATEGYRLRSAVSAALREVPPQTDAVLLIAPRRRLLGEAVAALGRYLETGGRLVALLEPGVESGLEDLLAAYGIAAPDAVLVDPASAGFEAERQGLDIIAHNYESHPTTRGLSHNRMTFFPGARSFDLRKPRSEDVVKRTVLSSSRSWRSEDVGILERGVEDLESEGVAQDYHAIAAVGRYPRGDGETRLAVFGDGDFASNRYLRAVYNLDLILNTVHWAVERESQITLRPKISTTVQFPLPLASTLGTFYGVGLLVPELLLIAGGIVWLRRRSA